MDDWRKLDLVNPSLLIDKNLWISILIKSDLLLTPMIEVDIIQNWLKQNQIPCIIDVGSFSDIKLWFPNKENAMAFKLEFL